MSAPPWMLLLLYLALSAAALSQKGVPRCNHTADDGAHVPHASFQWKALRQDTVLRIKVVFHIVRGPNDEYISDARIHSQLVRLNEDFSASNRDIYLVPEEFKGRIASRSISFELASRPTASGTAPAILRIETMRNQLGLTEDVYRSEWGGSTAWDPNRYLNIWVADLGGRVAGLGSSPGSVPHHQDGVLVHSGFFGKNNSARYNLGRVLVHEVGHYLGLNHPWEEQRDCQKLTPAMVDMPTQNIVYDGCPQYPQSSCGSSDMFMNFMGYVDDDCMLMFSEGQMNRMIIVVEQLRPGLLSPAQPPPPVDGSFAIYPNPVQDGHISVEFTVKHPRLVSIRLRAVDGRTVLHTDAFITDKLELPVGTLAPGIYLLTIDAVSKKLIVN